MPEKPDTPVSRTSDPPDEGLAPGALIFPRLVPIRPDQPGAYDNRRAIEVLKTLDLPVFLIWGGEDPITGPNEAFLRKIFKNVAPPLTIAGAGHFIQEDAGEAVADHIAAWMKEQGLTAVSFSS